MVWGGGGREEIDESCCLFRFLKIENRKKVGKRAEELLDNSMLSFSLSLSFSQQRQRLSYLRHAFWLKERDSERARERHEKGYRRTKGKKKAVKEKKTDRKTRAKKYKTKNRKEKKMLLSKK